MTPSLDYFYWRYGEEVVGPCCSPPTDLSRSQTDAAHPQTPPHPFELKGKDDLSVEQPNSDREIDFIDCFFGNETFQRVAQKRGRRFGLAPSCLPPFTSS